jgi:hypothetical protein
MCRAWNLWVEKNCFKSWDNELDFGMHGLFSSLGVKMFTFFASAIGDPKLTGNLGCTIIVVAPSVFLP